MISVGSKGVSVTVWFRLRSLSRGEGEGGLSGALAERSFGAHNAASLH